MASSLGSNTADLRFDSPQISVDRESARLTALDRYDVLDTPPEEAFDRITRLAKKLFDVPVALVSFIDAHRQWHKSCSGLAAGEAPRQHTFCQYVIADGQHLVINDASLDPRFRDNRYVVNAPHVRFYAGVPLTTGDGHHIGSLCLVDFRPRDFSPVQIEILSDLARMVTDQLELRVCATRDSLTNVLSRRVFKQEARRAAALALRHHHDLSAIAIDLDHFKSVNDTYGHAAGDRVLAGAARIFLDQIRETDLLGRLGGEEFAVLLPNTTQGGAMAVADKLRFAIGTQLIPAGDHEIRVTASFGIASLDASTRDAETLLDHADKALYEAKSTGRNRCVAWQRPATAGTQRRRVLKGGQIVFNGGMSVIDCTVRSLSEEGAGLDVSTSAGVPKRFTLAIKADGFEKPARTVMQTERHIEVAFA